MSEWVLYAGEVVWRFSKRPPKMDEDSREQRFWFRTFGLLVLAVFSGLALLLMIRIGDQFILLLQMVEGVTGAERLVFQVFLIVSGGLLLCAPLLFVSTVIVALVIGVLSTLGDWALLLAKIAGEMLRRERIATLPNKKTGKKRLKV